MKREIPTKSYITIFIFVLGLIFNINKSYGESVSNAYNNVINGKVKFRYVIDMSTLK